MQAEQNNSVQQIANLKKELDAERNQHLQQIAVNTQRPLSESEINARTLRKYLGQRASVSEGDTHWGAMGAIIAEVNDNNVLTLFVPAGYSSSQAWGQPVRCDKLHIVEVPKDGCAVQIKVIERYGTHTTYGEGKSWEDRNLQPTHVGMQRGQNVFNAQYRKDGHQRCATFSSMLSRTEAPTTPWRPWKTCTKPIRGIAVNSTLRRNLLWYRLNGLMQVTAMMAVAGMAL